jgi:hypothetical protein
MFNSIQKHTIHVYVATTHMAVLVRATDHAGATGLGNHNGNAGYWARHHLAMLAIALPKPRQGPLLPWRDSQSFRGSHTECMYFPVTQHTTHSVVHQPTSSALNNIRTVDVGGGIPQRIDASPHISFTAITTDDMLLL